MAPTLRKKLHTIDDKYRAEKQAIENNLSIFYRNAVSKVGITAEKLAKIRLKQLTATKVTQIKMAGKVTAKKLIEENPKIQSSYRVIANNTQGTETLIEHVQPDWRIIDSAIKSVETLMGYDVKVEEEEGKGETVIIVHSGVKDPSGPVDKKLLAEAWEVECES